MICANESKSETTLIQFGMGIVMCLVALAMLALTPQSISAQQNHTIAGDYAGTLGPLHVKLHLKQNAAGRVTGTLDSPERGAIGIHCDNFQIDGQSITFEVPAIQGIWKGTLAADGTLTGTWDQGHSLSLNFARETNVDEQKTLRASR
jgi:hypothetical protein